MTLLSIDLVLFWHPLHRTEHTVRFLGVNSEQSYLAIWDKLTIILHKFQENLYKNVKLLHHKMKEGAKIASCCRFNLWERVKTQDE